MGLSGVLEHGLQSECSPPWPVPLTLQPMPACTRVVGRDLQSPYRVGTCMMKAKTAPLFLVKAAVDGTGPMRTLRDHLQGGRVLYHLAVGSDFGA